ncbi:hypothetical protein ACFTZK_18645 [Streptomyces decoyicus]
MTDRPMTQDAPAREEDGAVPVAWPQPSARTMRPISVPEPLKIAVQPI